MFWFLYYLSLIFLIAFLINTITIVGELDQSFRRFKRVKLAHFKLRRCASLHALSRNILDSYSYLITHLELEKHEKLKKAKQKILNLIDPFLEDYPCKQNEVDHVFAQIIRQKNLNIHKMWPNWVIYYFSKEV